MKDIFEIIYRTSQTEGSPGTTTPAPSDVSWGDVKSKPFNSIGARLTVTSNTLSADIQTWPQITDKPFSTIGEGLEVVGDALRVELLEVTTTAVDYTVLTTDDIILVTESGVTITMPTAVGISGRTFTVDNASDSYIIITGTETIQGEATNYLPPNSSVELYSTGTNWRAK